jgi:hypothetical protein
VRSSVGGRLPAESRDAPIVKEILARLDALNDLIQDLLLFARPPLPRLAPMDLFLLALVKDLVLRDPHSAKSPSNWGSAPVLSADDLCTSSFRTC